MDLRRIATQSITLSGADGSGKSTTSRLLASLFINYSSICVHWFRGSHFLASILARLFSRFKVFQGRCNPYYGICIPRKFRGLWIHVEFWSLLPHIITRALLRRVCRFLVCDRGVLDFIVWVIVTLDNPGFLQSIYGRFLLRLASREEPIYLYADVDTLVKRTDVPRDFIARELAVYKVLAKYVSLCTIDTGGKSPLETFKSVLKCLKTQIH